MRIAFYAPMKAPGHRVPSGDRAVARALVAALSALGHEVALASAFRAFDRGDPARQRRLARKGAAVARDLVAAWRGAAPDLWFTYHLHHKAPDHLGPRVAGALGLPYVVAEPSVAFKRRRGPWAGGHASVLAALARADVLMPMTREDRDGLVAAGVPGERIAPLAPFLDVAPYRRARANARAGLAAAHGLDPARPLAVAVAMMRPGDKLASYRVLADALRRLDRRDLQLLVVGDGPRRGEVEALLGPRAVLAGAVPSRSLPGVLAGCDLFLWPAVNEAYGMALLAAQAAGVPVVAGRARGVPEIVVEGRTALLTAEGDAGAFARAVARLLDDPRLAAAMGAAAARHAAARHGLEAAMATLEGALDLARRSR